MFRENKTLAKFPNLNLSFSAGRALGATKKDGTLSELDNELRTLGRCYLGQVSRENQSSGFPPKRASNPPAELHRLARNLMFCS